MSLLRCGCLKLDSYCSLHLHGSITFGIPLFDGRVYVLLTNTNTNFEMADSGIFFGTASICLIKIRELAQTLSRIQNFLQLGRADGHVRAGREILNLAFPPAGLLLVQHDQRGPSASFGRIHCEKETERRRPGRLHHLHVERVPGQGDGLAVLELVVLEELVAEQSRDAGGLFLLALVHVNREGMDGWMIGSIPFNNHKHRRRLPPTSTATTTTTRKHPRHSNLARTLRPDHPLHML